MFPDVKHAVTLLGLFLFKLVIRFPVPLSAHHPMNELPTLRPDSSCCLSLFLHCCFLPIKGRRKLKQFWYLGLQQIQEMESDNYRWTLCSGINGKPLISLWPPVYSTDFTLPALRLQMASVSWSSLEDWQGRGKVLVHQKVPARPQLVCGASMWPGQWRPDQPVCHPASLCCTET